MREYIVLLKKGKLAFCESLTAPTRVKAMKIIKRRHPDAEILNIWEDKDFGGFELDEESFRKLTECDNVSVIRVRRRKL